MDVFTSKVKNIVLTGATRGLGLSHANYLANRGYNLAIIDISKEACSVYQETNSVDNLKSMLSKKGNRVEFYACDLTNAAMTNAVFASIASDFGELHALIANAGGDVSGDDHRAAGKKAINNNLSISQENHNQIFDRNYLTCFNSIRAIMPYLKQNQFGKIVTTASISAGYGVVQETAYAVAKAAVLHLTRCTAAELRPHGITVNCIAPGATLTGRFKATLQDRSQEDLEKINRLDGSYLQKPADPIHISSVIGFLISPESDYISGQVIRIDGGQITSPL